MLKKSECVALKFREDIPVSKEEIRYIEVVIYDEEKEYKCYIEHKIYIFEE